MQTFLMKKKINDDGSVTIIVWVKQDGIDTSKEDINKIHEDVSTTVKENNPDAKSFIFSDGSITSFGHILVPFLGFLVMLFV